jgi:AcrR family transcriptional regulator
MPAVTRTPRSSWIAEGLQALAAGGPDAVRVESIALKLGVTKGGFYGHFTDRGALLDEMLDAWERMSTDEVLERVEAEGGDAKVKLRRAGALTFSAKLLPIDLAVRDWSRREPSVAERLRRVDNRRMDYLRSLFATFVTGPDDVEARSALAFTLVIGNHFMAADHGARSRRDVLELAVKQLMA